MVNGLGVLGWGVGGIEAEAAMLGQPVSMLIPRVVGFKLHRRAARRRHRHRPGADHHRDAAQARRGRQVRGVLRRRRRRGPAGQPRHHRQHVAGVRLHLRDLPDRRRDHQLPEAHRPPGASSWRWSRPTPRPRACGTTRTASRPTPSTWSWTWPRWSPRSPARSARRTASCWPRPRTKFARGPAKTYGRPGHQADDPVTIGDGTEVVIDERRGRDRLDHLLHQHLQPVR